jgi:hypothetical protein
MPAILTTIEKHLLKTRMLLEPDGLSKVYDVEELKRLIDIARIEVWEQAALYDNGINVQTKNFTPTLQAHNLSSVVSGRFGPVLSVRRKNTAGIQDEIPLDRWNERPAVQTATGIPSRYYIENEATVVFDIIPNGTDSYDIYYLQGLEGFQGQANSENPDDFIDSSNATCAYAAYQWRELRANTPFEERKANRMLATYHRHLATFLKFLSGMRNKQEGGRPNNPWWIIRST